MKSAAYYQHVLEPEMVLLGICLILCGGHVKLGALQQEIHRDRNVEDVGDVKPAWEIP